MITKQPRLPLWRRTWLRIAGVRAVKDYLTMVSMREYEDEVRPVFNWERNK